MIMIQYCLGKVLVSKITDICYFHGREVGLPTVVCHDVVSLDVCYFHGREVGLHDRITDGGMPRCREFRCMLFPRS